jgi:hypothetical protein
MHGSKRICRYPCLIAAYHVLLRLLAPRHPSCALCSLINLILTGRSPWEIMITETLVSDSALKKLYYYPVCRCQRTSRALLARRSVWIPESLPSLKLKTVIFASSCFPLRPSPFRRWWAWQDSNLRPCAYQAHALTN